MSTPCILAVGDRSSWHGVPCKMDGYPEHTAGVVVDAVVRGGSVAAAAKQLVDDAPLGWDQAGGEKLDEADDFLAPVPLEPETPQDVFDRHYAVYLLDPLRNLLEIARPPVREWLEPARFGPDGRVEGDLPGWYPQPSKAKPVTLTRPEKVTEQLRRLCLEHGLRWNQMTGALADWVAARLGDLAGCRWLFLRGGRDAAQVCCFVGDTPVRAALDADGTAFTASDGRLRTLDLGDLALAESLFVRRGVAAAQVEPILTLWLSLAYEVGSKQPGARVCWYRGARCWNFSTPTGKFLPAGKIMAPVMQDDPFPTGWLSVLLAWLF